MNPMMNETRTSLRINHNVRTTLNTEGSTQPMSDYKHQLANDVSESWQAHGFEGWRPSMAYPYFVGFGLKKAKCGCGRVFKNVDDFYAHYLYKAIWELESYVLPSEWKDARANNKPESELAK